MSAKITFSLPPVQAFLDPATRRKVVLIGSKEIAGEPLSELEWRRALKNGWRVKHAGRNKP